MRESGYCSCSCRDCFDIAITSGGPALCGDCKDAGCDDTGDSECCRDDAYGADEVCEHGNWLCSEQGCENNTHEQA
jgi:hypothetical protein